MPIEEEEKKRRMRARALGAPAPAPAPAPVPELTQQSYVAQVAPARTAENIALGTEYSNMKADKLAFDEVESYRPRAATGWKGRRALKRYEKERPEALLRLKEQYRIQVNASDNLSRADSQQTKVNDANAYFLKNFGTQASSGDLAVSNNNIKGRAAAATVGNQRLVQATKLASDNKIDAAGVANKRGNRKLGLEASIDAIQANTQQGYDVENTYTDFQNDLAKGEEDFNNTAARDATLNDYGQVNTAIGQENAIELKDVDQVNKEKNTSTAFNRDVTKLFIQEETDADAATTAHLRELGKIEAERNFNSKIAGDRGQLWTFEGRPIQFQMNAEGYPVNPDTRERINLSGLYNARPTIEMKAAKGRKEMVTAFDNLVKNYIELADKSYSTNTNNNIVSNMWDSFNNSTPALGQALGTDRKRLLEVTDSGRQSFMDSIRAGQEVGARLMDTPIEVQRMMRPLGDVNNTVQGNLQIMQALGERNNLPSEALDAALIKFRSEDEPVLSEHELLLQEKEKRRNL